MEYIKVLRRYIEDNNLPIEIDLVPLDSREFRQRILHRYPDVEESNDERRLRIIWAMIDQVRDVFLRSELIEGIFAKR
ncbi:MAG: hypothetical protein HYW01_12510 [Deltaproteobacteria bacterium]|nr:hypothetical protein [Deltaproteobacteria bacterium]